MKTKRIFTFSVQRPYISYDESHSVLRCVTKLKLFKINIHFPWVYLLFELKTSSVR